MSVATRQDDQFIVRLPDGLRERIKAKAKENVRSMNSEIIFQLTRLYPSQAETKKADVPA